MQVLTATTTNANAVLAQKKHRQSCSVQFRHVVYRIQLCGVLVHRYQITSPICEEALGFTTILAIKDKNIKVYNDA